MTHDKSSNDQDESATNLLSRREIIAGLATTGVLASGAIAASSEDSVGIGGGPMSDALSHRRSEVYRVPSSEVPSEPETARRFFYVTDADDGRYSVGDLVEDTGDTVQRVDLGVRSLNTDDARITNWQTTGSRPHGQSHLFPPGAAMPSRENGVVTIEADDNKTETYNILFPEMKARGLPWATAISVYNTGDTGYCTWSQTAEMAAYGAEVATHNEGSGTVSNLPSASQDDVLYSTLDQKETVETHDIMVRRHTTSGTPDFESRDDMESFAGRLLAGEFMSIGHVMRRSGGENSGRGALGNSYYDQREHITNKSVTYIKRMVDFAAASGSAICFNIHPHTIGDTGNLTTSDLQTVLDYIETKRNNGNLNVVTPTTAHYLTGDCRDNHLNPFPGFEDSNVIQDSDIPGAWLRSSAAVTINTTTARNGTNSLEIGTGYENVRMIVGLPHVTNHIKMEGWVRSKGSGTSSEVRLQCRNADLYPDYSGTIGRRDEVVGDTWTHVATTWQVPKKYNATEVQIFNKDSTNNLLVDDFYVYPV